MILNSGKRGIIWGLDGMRRIRAGDTGTAEVKTGSGVFIVFGDGKQEHVASWLEKDFPDHKRIANSFVRILSNLIQKYPGQGCHGVDWIQDTAEKPEEEQNANRGSGSYAPTTGRPYNNSNQGQRGESQQKTPARSGARTAPVGDSDGEFTDPFDEE